MSAFKKLFSPHAWSRGLVDERIDAERDGVDLSPELTRELDAHLLGCPECTAFLAERRALLSLVKSAPAKSAPEGFAGRVLLAAKTRAPATSEPEPRFSVRLQLAFGGAALATAVVVFAAVSANGPHGPATGVEVSGRAGASSLAPQFKVRAVGIGAVKARATVTSIVDASGGATLSEGGRFYARIPRAQLVKVLQDLSRQGSYKVTQVEDELEAELSEIVLEIELE